MFTNDEIKNLRSLISEEDLTSGLTDATQSPTSFRKSNVFFLPSNQEKFSFVFQRCVDFVVEANKHFFKFEIEKIQTLQYTRYEKGQYYKEHSDISPYTQGQSCRKISFSVQLSEPNDYEGGDLIIRTNGEKFVAPKNLATIIFFPSFVLHEVTPVTKGVRTSLVGWVNGPKWK